MEQDNTGVQDTNSNLLIDIRKRLVLSAYQLLIRKDAVRNKILPARGMVTCSAEGSKC